MKTLTVIMAHREAQGAFDRHLNFWKSHGTDLLVMCPQDSVVETNLQVLCLGKKGHHSAMANWRFKTLLQYLTKVSYEWFFLNEYDSLCLTPALPPCPTESISSNLFTANQPEFRGHHFLHPPLQFSQSVLGRIVTALNKLPDYSENGFWDRLLGYACELGKVPMAAYNNLGFSRNTIEPGDIQAAVQARKNGAVLYHGVKTEPVLRALRAV